MRRFRAMTLAFGRASLDSAAGRWAAVGRHLDTFAAAWTTAEQPPEIGAFLPVGPEEVRRVVIVELAKIDLGERKRRGLPKAPEEYIREFPEVEAELARLFGANTTQPSSSHRPARAPDDIAPGDKLDDFDLVALLGEGQFAKVFLARQRSMQRLVALKVSGARGAEAETLAQLDHPNIVRVYDRRSLPDRDLHFVYMAYLPGGTLLDLLERVRKISQPERCGKTLLHAVDAALERRGEFPARIFARAAGVGRAELARDRLRARG